MIKMTNSTSQTVNTIIYECGKTHDTLLRPMKLQKLLYFCFGNCLIQDIELIDELFEGWAYGCVVPSVYHAFKGYGYSYIKEFGVDNSGKQEIINKSKCPNIYKIINTTIAQYVVYNDMYLSDINHQVNGAWWKARLRGERTISIKDIKAEFNQK